MFHSVAIYPELTDFFLKASEVCCESSFARCIRLTAPCTGSRGFDRVGGDIPTFQLATESPFSEGFRGSLEAGYVADEPNQLSTSYLSRIYWTRTDSGRRNC